MLNKSKKKISKNDGNDDIRRIVWFVFGEGIISALAVLFIALHNSDGTIQGINEMIVQVFIYFVLFSVISVICAGITFLLVSFFSWEVLRTAIHLTAKNLSARWLKKNSDNIIPYLRSFLYELLARNNDMLQLKLGQDQSCLIVNGADVRKNCVFYRFSLITTKPPHEDKQLRQIIQGFICSELNDYGIFGLSSTYKSITTQCYSVYLDRCFYDESNSSLVFDLLYICTEQSANYFNQAVVRDTENPKAEKTVFDDEII